MACSVLLPFDVLLRASRSSHVPSGTRRVANGDGPGEPGSPNATSSKFAALSCIACCNWSTSTSDTSRQAGPHCESVVAEMLNDCFFLSTYKTVYEKKMIYLTRLKEHEALHGYFASSVNDPLHFRDHVTFNQLDEARQTKSIGQFDKRDTGQGLQRRNSIRVQIVKQLAEGGLTHAWHLHLCVCTYTRRGSADGNFGRAKCNTNHRKCNLPLWLNFRGNPRQTWLP